MKQFISHMTKDYYYGLTKMDYRDMEVPLRPSPDYTWDGTTWVLDENLKKENNNNKIKQQLAETDTATIRVLEDIFTLLVNNKILKGKDLEDLSTKAMEKIKIRQELRKQIIK